MAAKVCHTKLGDLKLFVITWALNEFYEQVIFENNLIHGYP